MVDYYPVASSIKCYETSVRNVPTIARCIAKFLHIVLMRPDRFKYVHAIGFSLGGQLVGLVGKLMKAKGITFDRATGE